MREKEISLKIWMSGSLGTDFDCDSIMTHSLRGPNINQIFNIVLLTSNSI